MGWRGGRCWSGRRGDREPCNHVTFRTSGCVVRVAPSTRDRRIGERRPQTKVSRFFGRRCCIARMARSTEVTESVIDVPDVGTVQHRTETLGLVAVDTRRSVGRTLSISDSCKRRNQEHEKKHETTSSPLLVPVLVRGHCPNIRRPKALSAPTDTLGLLRSFHSTGAQSAYECMGCALSCARAHHGRSPMASAAMNRFVRFFSHDEGASRGPWPFSSPRGRVTVVSPAAQIVLGDAHQTIRVTHRARRSSLLFCLALQCERA